ncbi:MAG: ABC transporter substrate-binding protein [Tissierella sp.]|uniref:ABC transporter substrate-binding protein n=1 Tax=Tissierella sp. TaxID=41274 RepID=UPI003F985152
MKKRKMGIMLVLMLVSLSILTACGEKKPILNVYNWGDYIDKDVLETFEEEFDVKVRYSDFATNEDLYVKIKQGGGNYDVIFPSDYMIERMIKEDLLAKIDKYNIPNYEKIDGRFLNLDYDPNNEYSIPYMWGTVGIIYNKTMVDPLTKWEDLWDEKYKGEIIMLKSQRDTMAVALKKLGYSMNTRNIEELEEAKEELIEQKPLVYSYLGDEIKDQIVAENAGIGVVWSGDAVTMIRENPNLEYVIPEEGTNLWFDAMAIPKDSDNKELAEEFINFMSRPEISAKNAEYIGYSTPITEAKELLPEDLQNSLVAYPQSYMIENVEIFKDPTDIIGEYDRIWTEIMSEE